MDDLLARGSFETTRGDVTWVVDRARLVDVRVAGSTAGALPAAPPDPPTPGRPLPRTLADEALVLARKLPSRRVLTLLASRLSGIDLRRTGDGRAGAGDRQLLGVPAGGQRRGERRRRRRGSQSRQTVGPLPDSHPHQAPASSPLARATRAGTAAAKR